MKTISFVSKGVPIIFSSRNFREIINTFSYNFEKMLTKNSSISIFSKIEFVDQSKPCTQIYLFNIASCINLQLPIVILKKNKQFS